MHMPFMSAQCDVCLQFTMTDLVYPIEFVIADLSSVEDKISAEAYWWCEGCVEDLIYHNEHLEFVADCPSVYDIAVDAFLER